MNSKLEKYRWVHVNGGFSRAVVGSLVADRNAVVESRLYRAELDAVELCKVLQIEINSLKNNNIKTVN